MKPALFAAVFMFVTLLIDAQATAPVRGSGAFKLRLLPEATTKAFALTLDLNRALLPANIQNAFVVLRPIDAKVTSRSAKTAERSDDSASVGAVRIPLLTLLKGEKIQFTPFGQTLSGVRAQLHFGSDQPSIYASFFANRETDGSFKPTTLQKHYARLRKQGIGADKHGSTLMKGAKKPFRRDNFEESLRFESPAKEAQE